MLLITPMSVHTLLNLNIFPRQKQVIFLLVFLMAVQLPPFIKVRLNIHSPLFTFYMWVSYSSRNLDSQICSS